MSDSQQTPDTPRAPNPASQRAGGGRWDLVDESSWQSFPASDAPSWATPGPDSEDVHTSRPTESESPGEAQARGGEARALRPLRRGADR